jgi:hypothetical protein
MIHISISSKKTIKRKVGVKGWLHWTYQSITSFRHVQAGQLKLSSWKSVYLNALRYTQFLSSYPLHDTVNRINRHHERISSSTLFTPFHRTLSIYLHYRVPRLRHPDTLR